MPEDQSQNDILDWLKKILPFFCCCGCLILLFLLFGGILGMTQTIDPSKIWGSGSPWGGGQGGKVKKDCIELLNSRAKPYVDKINEAAKKFGQDPALMLAQLQAESSFNPTAVSSAGAQGIAQFMPGTWSHVSDTYNVDGNGNGTKNVWEPEDAIYAQAAFNQDIENQLKQNGINPSMDNVLASYNAGEGAVIKYGGVPPYKETKDYVAIIKKLYEEYKKCLEESGITDKNACFPIDSSHLAKNWDGNYYGTATNKDIGFDINVLPGAEIIAVTDGTIDPDRYGLGDGWGKNRIWVDTGTSTNYYYAHLDKLYVEPGQKVKKGDVLGVINTPTVTHHLHFGIGVGRDSNNPPKNAGSDLQWWNGNWWINPSDYLYSVYNNKCK